MLQTQVFLFGKKINVKLRFVFNINFFGFGQEVVTLFSTFKILLIGRKFLEGQIIHTFIKFYVVSRTNITNFTIIPKDVWYPARNGT